VFEPLLALGEFFKKLCANVLHDDLFMKMHCNIVVILCKLEITFLLGFWNVMEHLPVHLTQVLMIDILHFASSGENREPYQVFSGLLD